jgi:flagellar basal body-associated protein FliL
MAGMDERRRDEGAIIIIGCLIVGMLLVLLTVGMAAIWMMRAVPVRMQQQQATIEEQQAQVQAIADEEKASPQQEAK